MAQLADKLITFAFLKNEVDLPQNIDDSDLDHKIYTAQQTLRMVMGDKFYQDLVSNYKSNTLSLVYTRVYDPYIKQYIAWQAYEGWIITANFKPTRSGIRVHSEDNSVPATDVQMAIIIKDVKQKSQYYKKLFVDFLNGHSSDYPLYKSSCNNNLTGNSFRITAVKNKHHNHCNCRSCRC